MAGYQNKKGYSGADVDMILYDHYQKAAPTQVTLNISSPTSWDGTVYAEGTIQFSTDWQSDFPYSKFSYNGITFVFNFLNQENITATVIAQKKALGSDSDTTSSNINNIILTTLFLAHDLSTEIAHSVYRLYCMEIIYNPTSTSSPMSASVKILPLDYIKASA